MPRHSSPSPARDARPGPPHAPPAPAGRPGPATRARRSAALVLAAALALPVSLAGQAVAPLPAAQAEDTPEQWLADLSNPEVPQPRREHAALCLARSPAADAPRLAAWIARPDDAAGAGWLLIDAVARLSDPDPALLEPIIEVLAASSGEQRPRVLAAVGSFRTRQAVGALVAAAGEGPSAHDRRAAIDALIRATGRSDLGWDPARWEAWFEERRWLGEADWREEVARGQAARADALAAELRAVSIRLSEGARRFYLAASAEERATLLADWLADGSPALRDAAFDLIQRELASGRAVPSTVGQAALAWLAHADPAVRTRAALVVSRLPATDAGAAVARALQVETDEVAAATLLQAAARWPSPAVRDAVVRWVGSGPPAAPAAMEAALTLLRAGLLEAAPDRQRVLDAVRATNLSELPPGGLRLLVLLGDDADRDALTRRAIDNVADQRPAIAAALAEDPRSVEHVLALAESHPALGGVAARAVAAHRSDAASVLRLAALPAPSSEARAEWVLQAAAVLPVDQLVLAAEAPAIEPALRESMLSRLARVEGPPAPQAAPDPARARGLLLLAQTRLDLGRPDAALQALDALSRDEEALDAPRAACLRTVTYLWLNRLGSAWELEAPASAWIDGLRRAVAAPHARAIEATIASRFAGRLTADEQIEIDELMRRARAIEDGEAPPPPLTRAPD